LFDFHKSDTTKSILYSREATNKYRNYKIRIVADDTRSVRLKTLSAGPQRKNMYETHCTGGTAKEPPASIATMYRANVYVRSYNNK